MDICRHNPPCPGAYAIDREAARAIVAHPDQGWSLLCNGVVLFDDTGGILPDARLIPPHRPTDCTRFGLAPAGPTPAGAAQASAHLHPVANQKRVVRS